MGHFSKDCPKPRDYSRVTCNNCGESWCSLLLIAFKADTQPEGHTAVRCKAEKKAEDNAEANGYNDASVPNDAPAAEVGDWNAEGDAGVAW